MAITIALYLVVLLGIILIVRRITRPPDQELVAGVSVRVAAFGIDFAIIAVLHEILLSVVAGYPPVILFSFLYMGPYAIFSFPIMILSVMFSYLFFFLYLLFPYGIIYFGSTFYIIAVGFGYFLLLESLTRGKTVGKAILRIRTVKRDGKNPISVREGVMNALGKSVLLWDLIIGLVARSMNASRAEQKQIRATQQLSDVVVVNTRIDSTQQVQFEGPDWWKEQDSKESDNWEDEKGG
ncbi:MAG: RDD family protein [Candidatus Thorarchaeota archaeon]